LSTGGLESISMVTLECVSVHVKYRIEYDYRLVYAAEVNTYWSIIDQSYVHHRTEDAVLDTVLAVKGADLAKEAVV
jgi:hypothetical protein